MSTAQRETTRRIKKLPPVPPQTPDWPHPYVQLGFCPWTGTWMWQDKFGNCSCGGRRIGIRPRLKAEERVLRVEQVDGAWSFVIERGGEPR